MGGPSSQAMIVHFPPCWNLIYSRLPHEMATSSMVCVRCAFAQLLTLHATSHTSGLINMMPRGNWLLGDLRYLLNSQPKESKIIPRVSWSSFGLWWACNCKLLLRRLWGCNAAQHRHPSMTRKCHSDFFYSIIDEQVWLLQLCLLAFHSVLKASFEVIHILYSLPIKHVW